MSEYHVPVLLKESVDGLDIRQGGVYLDLTFGGGGHSGEILKRLDAEGCLLGFDQDEDALANVPEDDRFIFVNHNFRYLRNFMRYYSSGVSRSLGFSSTRSGSTARSGFLRWFTSRWAGSVCWPSGRSCWHFRKAPFSGC